MSKEKTDMETCRICERKIESGELADLVPMGYGDDGKPRAAHGRCFRNAKEIFAVPLQVFASLGNAIHRIQTEIRETENRIKLGARRTTGKVI